MLDEHLSVPTSGAVEIDFPEVEGTKICRVQAARSVVAVYARPAKGSGKSEPIDLWVRAGNATKLLEGPDAQHYVRTHWG